MSKIIAENVVQRDIMSFLERNNIFHHRNPQMAGSKVGIPDVTALYKGFYVAIEVKKSEGGEASKAQEVVIAKVKKDLGKGILAESVQDVIDLFQEIDPEFIDSNKKEYETDALIIKKR